MEIKNYIPSNRRFIVYELYCDKISYILETISKSKALKETKRLNKYASAGVTYHIKQWGV